MRRGVLLLIVMVGVAVAFIPMARGDEPGGASEVASLFRQGQADFEDGLAKRAADPAAARQAFERAASTWRSIVDEHDVHNGRLLYNIGNAQLLAGQLGPAILAYRQAEQFIAGDRHLVENLHQARKRVLTHIEPQPTARLRQVLLFWHDDLSTPTRLWLFALLFGSAWLWGLVRLAPKCAPWPRWPAFAAGLAALALAASLLVEQARAGEHLPGVVMHEVVGRKGPSEQGYEPSFTEALAEGVEFTVAEDRRAWLLTHLADGRETWLRRDAVGLVD